MSELFARVVFPVGGERGRRAGGRCTSTRQRRSRPPTGSLPLGSAMTPPKRCGLVKLFFSMMFSQSGEWSWMNLKSLAIPSPQ